MAHAPHLTARQRTALSVPPLLLRLVLAIIFIWAGYTKIFGFMDVTDENRAALVAAGVLQASTEAPVDETPIDEPVDPPADEPSSEPAPEPDPVDEPAGDPAGDPASDPADEPAGEPDPTEPVEDPVVAMVPAPGITLVAQSSPERVRKLNGLAMLVYAAANPEPTLVDDEDGTLEAQRPMPLWPSAIGSPPWPVVFARAAAWTELIAGVLLLVGLFTRLGGLSIAGIMGVAMWLTQIGPALQSGDTWLGFLPMNDPMDPASYTKILYQLALLAMGLALLFSGPGMLSIDRWIFGKSVADDDD